MQAKPYLADAIIGNSSLLITLDNKGEIHRLFWPEIDYGQNIRRLVWGVYLPGESGCTVWQDDPSWKHAQQYESGTNILVTTAVSREMGLEVSVRDAVWTEGDVLVRQVTFRNTGRRPVTLGFIQYHAIRMEESPLHNTAFYDAADSCLVHYRRNRFIIIGADRPVHQFTCTRFGEAWEDAQDGQLGGRPIEQGDTESALTWNLGILAPAQETTLNLFLAAGENLPGAKRLLRSAIDKGGEALISDIRLFWGQWLDQAVKVEGLPADVESLYHRSLLALKLLTSRKTGAIIAAPEVDPEFVTCGGYGFCWGRDAAFITLAMDRAGYPDLARRFCQWAMKTQEPEGHWIHRYYADGSWAPSWGLIQVDETGSVLCGMAEHYRLTGDSEFLRTVWESVKRAADFLVGFRDPKTGLPLPSVDLWEEQTGEFTYSAAAVYGGLMGAAELADAHGDGGLAALWRATASDLRSRILETCWDEGRGAFIRGLGLAGPDITLDSSLLGLVFPFEVIPVGDERMRSTANLIAARLAHPKVGGIGRYEGDTYRGGNPWIICTLWLGVYQLRNGDIHGAKDALEWSMTHANALGLLPEQVDRERGGPAWVVPLAWSLAMFILLVLELYGGKQQ